MSSEKPSAALGDPLRFRKRLLSARRSLGFTQREMATRLLTPLTVYVEWERATKPIPGAAVAAAELLCGCRPGVVVPDYFIQEHSSGAITAAEIAKCLGVTRETISARLRDAGAESGRAPRTRAIIERIRAGNMSMADIAHAFGVSRQYVTHLRQSFELPPPQTDEA